MGGRAFWPFELGEVLVGYKTVFDHDVWVSADEGDKSLLLQCRCFFKKEKASDGESE